MAIRVTRSESGRVIDTSSGRPGPFLDCAPRREYRTCVGSGESLLLLDSEIPVISDGMHVRGNSDRNQACVR